MAKDRILVVAGDGQISEHPAHDLNVWADVMTKIKISARPVSLVTAAMEATKFMNAARPSKPFLRFKETPRSPVQKFRKGRP